MFRILPDPAPALVTKHLAPQEHDIITLRMHPSILIPPIIVGIGGLSAAIAVVPLMRGDAALELAVWLFVGLLLAQLVRAVFSWLTKYIVVTQLRVFICSDSGIAWSSPLRDVADVRITRSVSARLLGFGTLVFESAHLAIDNVPYAEQVYLEIYMLLHKEDEP